MTKNQELVLKAFEYGHLFAQKKKVSFEVNTSMISMHFYVHVGRSIYTTDLAKKRDRNFLWKRDEEIIKLLSDEDCREAITILWYIVKKISRK